jgi:hypothetical protein
MATQTIAEAGRLINDQIVRGVAEDIISINPMYSVIPFTPYQGQGLIIPRELALGGTGYGAVGTALTSTQKAAATYTVKTVTAIKLIGDAEMDGLVQVQSMSAGVDQVALEIASKSKSIGRLFQTGMAQGNGSTTMRSLHSECDATQYCTAATTRTISFELLDELLDLIKSKDGAVDFIVMPARTIRSYKTLLRNLGGTPADWVVELPDGRSTIGYESIPIFKNEYLSTAETSNGAALTGGALTSVYAGVWDDGSGKVGCGGIYPAGASMGIVVEYIGYKENYDEQIWRVKWYTNFVCFNRRGLARLTSISN